MIISSPDGVVRVGPNGDELVYGNSSSVFTALTLGSKALLLGPKIAITDGTAAGSTQIGAPGGILKNFVVHGSEVFAVYAYQQATGGAPPLSLWVTDGTAAGTRVVQSVADGDAIRGSELAVTDTALFVTYATKANELKILRMAFPTMNGPDAGSPRDPATDGGGAPSGDGGTSASPDAGARNGDPTSAGADAPAASGACSVAVAGTQAVPGTAIAFALGLLVAGGRPPDVQPS